MSAFIRMSEVDPHRRVGTFAIRRSFRRDPIERDWLVDQPEAPPYSAIGCRFQRLLPAVARDEAPIWVDVEENVVERTARSLLRYSHSNG